MKFANDYRVCPKWSGSDGYFKTALNYFKWPVKEIRYDSCAFPNFPLDLSTEYDIVGANIRRGMSAKKFDIRSQFDIWLVWSIGRYANGHPMIELRGVYTSPDAAKTGKKIVENWSKTNECGQMGVIPCERAVIEKRNANHTYGVSMQALKYLR